MHQVRRTLVAAISALLVSLPMATAGLAEVETNTTIPLNQIVLVPCANGGAGELVQLSGTLHVVDSLTTDAQGGIHRTLLFQPQGGIGTGLTTGTIYRATGETRYGFNVNGPFEPNTFVNNFKIIGPGPANNWLVHETVHVSMDANGQIRATVDNLSVECR